MSETSLMSTRVRPGDLLFRAWWVVPAVLSANSLYLRSRVSGGETSWLSILAVQLAVWSLWLIFTPLILQLGKRVPFVGPPAWRGAAFHLIAGIVFALAYLAVYACVLMLSKGGAWTAEQWIRTYSGVFIAVFHWDVLIYWAILGVGRAVDYYREAREREVRELELERSLLDARLAGLRSQMQPHFLFNALHAVGSLVRADKKEKAVRMLAGLSDLLRVSLDRSDEQESTLAQELDLVRNYLDIQCTRFEDRLQTVIEVPSELLDARVPALSVQPLVENAIRHGLDRRPTGGRVSVEASRRNGSLRIDVCNDGPRLPHDFRLEDHHGLGLRNTRERLLRLYGPTAELRLENADGGGVRARMEVPQS